MVYGRQRSQGCILCRKRKVKCDEGKPTCNNCKAHGKECPGYSKPSSPFIFRNENKKAEKLVQKGQKRHENNQNPQFGPETKSETAVSRRSGTFEGPLINVSVSVPRYLFDSTWEDRSHCYFLDQFTLPQEIDGSPGPLDSVPTLYTFCQRGEDTSGAPLSCLQSALDAVAFATLANQANVPSLAIHAKKKYGQALRDLNKALSSVETAVRDETMGAIVMLTLFEDVNSERESLLSIHIKGIQYLLKLRGLDQLFNPATRSLFHFAFTQMSIQLLGLNDPLLIDVDWLMGVFTVQYPVYNMMAGVLKISKFRATVAKMLSPESQSFHPSTQESLTSMLEMGERLGLEFDQWYRGTPDEWLPQSSPTIHGETIITYPDITSAGVWNYYRGATIALQLTLIEIHHRLNSLVAGNLHNTTDSNQFVGLQSPENIIKNTVVGICQTIPFALGDVDRFGFPTPMHGKPGVGIKAIQQFALLWPIWTVTQCGLATAEQDKQARVALQRIGLASGIKLGLALADQNTVLDRATLSSPSHSPVSSPPKSV
ncbi:hypothetical protein ASPWEDRAFT_702358 [Aspergillus wentii DTO 134E9]|uniref:Zn(2)-C6 fungal-type domain-containing protein n=1 Tax=Aspergillus wentii DTO 134E9 TaxID=1073089 RepID=A0A1L9R5M8_ASPWE|nr:uncharacterized protein ASPWEDRAFT_702358 [Aspergillus wentii DTO 134E9]OJJ30222.1 hypothetical protein ASPWEDRAFT_702358 [Aspergillus wentii DTO 134E9]